MTHFLVLTHGHFMDKLAQVQPLLNHVTPFFP